MIKELCISGGGVKGLAFLGALYELEIQDKLIHLEKISGTSIGAFIAIAYLIGYRYDLKELINILFEYDLSTLKDIHVGNFFKRKSIMIGKKLELFFTDIIAKKIDPNTTLEKLYNISKIELYVPVCCVETNSLEIFSHITHPSLTLVHLIRMATAIPFLLQPVEYRDKLYIDAAVVENTLVLSEKSFIICAESSSSNTIAVINNNNNNKSFFNYVLNVLKIVYESNKKEKNNDHEDQKIKVKVENVNVTSFNITKDQKFKLLHYGRQSVKKIYSYSST